MRLETEPTVRPRASVVRDVKPLTYAVVTAVRDEMTLLGQLAACLRRQTIKPFVWHIVDTGSTDGTAEMVELWLSREPWIRLTRSPTPVRSRGGVIAGAIETGAMKLDLAPDVLVVVDADVTFEPHYFERLLAAFQSDPLLGIASGSRYEQEGGRWRRRYVTGTSVEAQCRAYRWSCLGDVLPLEKEMGWAGIDEIKANVRGWRTAVLDEPDFRHHRRIGSRERSRFRAWWVEGRGAHFMGYRTYYAILRSLFWSRRDPTAITLAAAYLVAALKGEPRVRDPEVRAYLRKQQSLLRLPVRAAEALGLRRQARTRTVDVLLVADSGGHLFELAGLRDVWAGFSHAWVTVRGPDTGFLEGESVYFAHGPTTRSIGKLFRNTLLAQRLLRTLRPAVVLTTGAGLSVPFAWVGRLFGARVLYVECSGRVGISLSCRLVAPIADRLYVQWPDAVPLAPRARYAGSIFFSPE